MALESSIANLIQQVNDADILNQPHQHSPEKALELRIARTQEEGWSAEGLAMRLLTEEIAGLCANIHLQRDTIKTYFLIYKRDKRDKKGKVVGAALSYFPLGYEAGTAQFLGMCVDSLLDNPDSQKQDRALRLDLAKALGWYMLLVAKNSSVNDVIIKIPDKKVSFYQDEYGFVFARSLGIRGSMPHTEMSLDLSKLGKEALCLKINQYLTTLSQYIGVMQPDFTATLNCIN